MYCIFSQSDQGEKAKNAINLLIAEDGSRITDKEGIAEEAVGYYKKLIGTTSNASSTVEEIK